MITPEQRAWLHEYAPQILELVSHSGMRPYEALQILATVATGYPASSPPRWCDTGCKHREGPAGCRLITRWCETPVGSPPPAQAWMDLQQWDNTNGQPLWPILCDCPDFEAAKREPQPGREP